MSPGADIENDALGDSEATLRQAETVLTDLGEASPELSNGTGAATAAAPSGTPIRGNSGFREFIQTLIKTYLEMAGVVENLRASRGVLEQAASYRLMQTHQSLVEVSSATQTAATGILDGLDRALELVDLLDPAPAPAAPGDESVESNDYGSQLRNELQDIMGHVQFQDITAQQLGHSCVVLQDIEARLIALADFFDIRGLGLEELAALGVSTLEDSETENDSSDSTCDPGASTLNAEARQNVADEIFTSQ